MPKAKSSASGRRRERQEQRRELKRAGGAAAWRELGADRVCRCDLTRGAGGRSEEGARSALSLPRAWSSVPAGGMDGLKAASQPQTRA